MVQKNEIDCYKCGGKMNRSSRLERVAFEGLESAEFEAPMFLCENCGAELETGRQIMVTESQMNILKARAQAEQEAR